MKVLLLDNFYKTIHDMKILLVLLALLGGCIILFTDGQLPVQAFIFITFLSISVLALTSIRRDSVTRWNRYERTMPIKQKTIVLSKYISYILWVLVATVIAVIFTHMLVAVKGHQYFDFGMRDILTIFFVSVAFSLSICSFFYLGLYLIGYQKCDILIMISAILSVCFTAIMIVILNSADITIETGRIIILGVSVVFLLLSYNITKSLYRKSEV